MPDRKPNRYLLPAMAFLAPVLLYLAVMAAAGITPFGDHTLLLWDANNQNTAFMAYWKSVLTGQADALYTLGRTLGGSAVGLIAFYLASPLNLLLLLPYDFPLLYSVLVVLKIGLCGLTFFVFLRKRAWSSLLFSTSYALSGFMAVYCFRAAWLDAVILLPLVALGIRRIHAGGPPWLYLAALFLGLASQYYFGYMLCVFSVLYFLCWLPRWNAKTVGRFLLASGLAAGLAAGVLLPVYHTLAEGYSLFSGGLLTLEPVNTLPHLLTKFYTAAVSTVQLRSNSPNYYVGIPLLLLAALYLTNRAAARGERLRSLLLLLLLFISFWLAAPYYAWHAFDAPNFYPARFSFVFSFLLIETAYRGFETPGRQRLRTAVFAAAFLVSTYLLFRPFTMEYLSYKTIVFDAAVCVAACLLLGFCRNRRVVLWLLVVMQVAGLYMNSFYAYRRLSTVYTATAANYTQEVARVQALVDRVQAEDGTLYRMEKNFRRNDNDPLLYGYRGLSHMSSDLDQAFFAFCRQIGLYQGNYHLAYRSGATPVVDSLFGVQYLLQKDGVAFAPLPDGYTPLWTDGDVTAYENTYALPLAYVVPAQTLALTDGSVFENQNLLLSDLTGTDAAVFDPVYDMERTDDGTWETDTFPVQAGRPLYLYSLGTEYTLNGTAQTGDRMNGTVLLPAAQEDTVYTVRMTAPLGAALAYFDLAAFRRAQQVLAAHTAQVESDTDSHLVITATAAGGRTQLLLTLPYDAGWQVRVDGIAAKAAARYGALLSVDLGEGTHTVELRFVPVGLKAGLMISAASLLLLALWAAYRRKRRPAAGR